MKANFLSTVDDKFCVGLKFAFAARSFYSENIAVVQGSFKPHLWRSNDNVLGRKRSSQVAVRFESLGVVVGAILGVHDGERSDFLLVGFGTDDARIVVV